MKPLGRSLQAVEEGKRTTHRDRIDLGFGKITYHTYHTNDTRLRYYSVDVMSNTPGIIRADTINIRAERFGNGTTEAGNPGSVATDRTGNLSAIAPGNNEGSISIDLSTYVEREENGGAMFSLDREPGHTYLLETRNRFVDTGFLYGSQYFFDRVGYDRSSEVKVLGDAFYEERLVMRAIMQAICEKYLGDGIKSDQEEMKYLLDNAIEASRDLNLSVGVALTKEQINALREPIIWYVERQVLGVTALAPVVYIPENILAGLPVGGAPKLTAAC
jgi:large exoprotein involved in heme utilization and adhesion